MLRLLGQAEYGLYSLVNTTIAYLTILDFGFGITIVRYTVKYRAEQNKEKEEALYGMFLLLYCGIGIVAFLLALLLVFNIGSLFSDTLTVQELYTAKILMWLAAVNVAMSFPFSVYASIITAHERFVFAKSIHIFRQVINPLLMVAVLSLGYKAIGMIVVTTVLNIAFNLINLLYCKTNLKIKMRFSKFDRPLFKEICVYSFFIFLNLIVDRLYWNTGQFLLGMFVSTVAVATYAIGIQFITMLYMPISAATSSLFLPRITQISVKAAHGAELLDLFIRVGRIQFIMLALVLTGFGLYGMQFIHLWAGAEYSASYPVAMILMISSTVHLTQTLGVSILYAKNMHAFRSVMLLIIALVNVPLSIALIKIWGTVGCAAGTGISLMVGQIVIMNVYYHIYLKLDMGKFWWEIVKILPAVLCPFGLAILALRIFPAVQLTGFIANVIFYTVAYSVSMYFIGMNQYEKQFVIDPLRRMVGKVRGAKG
jgi:O-antigen/teichoic acid export membrane protein